jgi:hypothetical protein
MRSSRCLHHHTPPSPWPQTSLGAQVCCEHACSNSTYITLYFACTKFAWVFSQVWMWPACMHPSSSMHPSMASCGTYHPAPPLPRHLTNRTKHSKSTWLLHAFMLASNHVAPPQTLQELWLVDKHQACAIVLNDCVIELNSCHGCSH